MTVEATPLGSKCNLRCRYCYENPMRDCTTLPVPEYEKILEGLLRHDQDFIIFGGEPLMVPIDKLEMLWRAGLKKYGKNGCQTNGSLITSHHMELFRKYNVHVGFSIDGPGELNDARQAPSGSVHATRRLTEKSCGNFEACLKDPDIKCSLILTLHRLNGSRERLPKLMSWLRHLAKLGLKDIRVHLLENNSATDLVLDDDELLDAFRELEIIPLNIDMIKECKQRLETGEGGSCVFHSCDPSFTQAVKGVGPEGEELNCGRVNKDGIDYLKAAGGGPIRAIVLRNTPQSCGGCGDCEYWYACSGYCPGSAIAGDWRYRTEHCSFLKKYFAYLVGKHEIKLLDNPHPSFEEGHGDYHHKDSHGDSYTDSGHADGTRHVNVPHGDKPHVDRFDLPRLEVK